MLFPGGLSDFLRVSSTSSFPDAERPLSLSFRCMTAGHAMGEEEEEEDDAMAWKFAYEEAIAECSRLHQRIAQLERQARDRDEEVEGPISVLDPFLFSARPLDGCFSVVLLVVSPLVVDGTTPPAAAQICNQRMWRRWLDGRLD